MTVYADYSYYTSTFGGTVIESETAFAPLAARASLILDQLTAGRAEGYADLDELKMACCAIAEQVPALQNAEASARSGGAQVASQSVGSFSVSYRSGAEASASIMAYIKELASLYLGRTGLLYRGVPRLWD